MSEDDNKFVPGVRECRKCGFVGIYSTLSSSGISAADENSAEYCPNGCGPLWRVSKEDYEDTISNTGEE